MDVINKAADIPLTNAVYQQRWVLKAFHNALWQLTNAPNLEEGIVATVMLGEDTDINAAICGVLLGSVYGVEAIPVQWKKVYWIVELGLDFQMYDILDQNASGQSMPWKLLYHWFQCIFVKHYIFCLIMVSVNIQ